MTPGGSLHKGWQPMARRDTDGDFVPNPDMPDELRGDEVWLNDRYQCVVRYMKSSDQPEGKDGMLHLSIHTHDRGPVRNWRHLQQIKNEVAGELRTAVEIFPPENRLTDTSNEYHLWVMPDGVDIGFGFGTEDQMVSDDEVVEAFNRGNQLGAHKGRQEEWEPGLTTGRTEHSETARKRMRDAMRK